MPTDDLDGEVDRPKHHLTFAEGIGFGVTSAAAVQYVFPDAAFLLAGVGGLIATVAMHRNGSYWDDEVKNDG